MQFEQDGATAHTTRISKNFLRETFPGHLIMEENGNNGLFTGVGLES